MTACFPPPLLDDESAGTASRLLLLLLSRFSRVRLCATPWTAAHWGYPRPWDSPGKNTGVGCHFLLQCMEVKSESEVAQLCPTLSDPMDCSLPDSSVHGIFQARVLEWVAIAFSLVGLKKAGASLPVQAKNTHIFSRKTVGKDGETSFLTHFLCTRHFASVSFNPHDDPMGQFFVPTLK